MNVQVIEKNGQPEWAVLPYSSYLKLLEDAEMLADIGDYDAAKAALAQGEELVPSEVVYAILDGGNPIKVWREYRGLNQQQLAQAAGLSASYLSQIESGKRNGTTEALTAVAQALNLTIDDLV
jgi:DNA-binding XRE family transcriptional regulator